MAGRKRRDPVTEAAAAAAAAVAATQTADLVIEPADDDAEVIEDVLEGLRRLDTGENRVTWYVYSNSAGKTGSSEGYIEKLRSDQLDEARFKSLYGPGEYRIVGRTREGGYVKGSHKIVRISDIGATDPDTGGATDAVALLREMRASEEKRAQQRAENLKTTAAIVATPLATILAALIARRPALDMPALITALRPQQNSLTEMTTALANLKQLESGGGSNVDLVLKLLDRLQDMPGGSGGDGWLGVIRDVVREVSPAVRDVVGQITQPKPAAAIGAPIQTPAPAALPAAVPTNGAAPGAVPVQATDAAAPMQEDNAMWALVQPWLKRQAENLLDEAASNMPVELSAEHLLTAAEKKFGGFLSQQDLVTLLSRPDWWEFVIAFHPPLAPFQAWVADVRQEILGMLQESIRESGHESAGKSAST